MIAVATRQTSRHVSYFEGTVSVPSGVFHCRIGGIIPTRRVCVEIIDAGTIHQGSVLASAPLDSDALSWSDFDAALRLADKLGRLAPRNRYRMSRKRRTEKSPF